MTDDNTVPIAPLTLENYLARTGKRFRMTKSEMEAVKNGTKTREQVFQERMASK